ncbi:uncharacterized protein LOC124265852 [Haliotis rubra]|uniref:uncharacterized protein LOC124265852 n=1 Tax=Haliotis rubra TaxID=36100 RepID=UPI001EE5D115|nr:uncharacterized protein LOC124265852 [Haliotis rubra]
MPIELKSPPNTLKATLEIEAPPSVPSGSPVTPKEVEQAQIEASEAVPAVTIEHAAADPDLNVDKVTVRTEVNTKDSGNHTDDSEEDVCATYVPMGKPLRALRKSKTFTEGVFTKPHIFTHQHPSNTPPTSRNFRDTLNREEERPFSIYQNSAVEDVDDETEEIDNIHLKYFNAFNATQDKPRSVYMEPDTSLRVGHPRGLALSSSDLKTGRPTDDLFKWGWWKPDQSSHNVHDELETKHDGAVKVVPDFDLYVRMGGRSTGSPGCRPPPGDGRRSRSLTVPNIFASEFEDAVSDDLPKLSLWCPPSPSGEFNSESTIKFNTCPRPCSVAHYVNFKGSIPPK